MLARGRRRLPRRLIGLLLPVLTLGALTWPVPAQAAPAGLVAAYAFDEGSGTTVSDASGSGNNGTVSGTSWTTSGKNGGALSFNGTTSRVTVPDSASLHLTTAMTLEAWVNPTTVTKAWRDVIYKGNDNYYLEATSSTGSIPAAVPDGGGIIGGVGKDAFGTTAITASTWTHLAATYDGTTVRLFVNGTQVATKAAAGSITTSTNPLQIGGDSIYGQFFSGLIDDVRVYSTALTAAQIATDMATGVGSGSGDTQNPTDPTGLAANAVSSHPDQPELDGLHRQRGGDELPRGAVPGRRLRHFAQIATTAGGTTYNNTGLTAGTILQLPGARHRCSREPGPLLESSRRDDHLDSRHPSPTAPANLDRHGRERHPDQPELDGLHRQRGGDGVPPGAVPGASCTNFAQVATPPGTTYNDTGLTANTTYRYRVRATDAAGNLSGYSNIANATTQSGGGGTPGLVAAYAFDEGSGTTVSDASGSGNNGTVSGTTWTTSGKNGGALSFNGTTSRVTVPDAASLHLTTAMTLEAWVNPTTVTKAWRDVIYKGNDNYYLEATSRTGSIPAAVPDGGGSSEGWARTPSAPRPSRRTPGPTWPRPTTARTVRLYVNGTQVATRPPTGTITTSTNPLQIGGDSIYGQFFAGLIDDVRVYSTALTAAQIATDMATAVGSGSGDTQNPTDPTGLAANAVSTTQVNLSWTASTDNVGVTNYLLERCTGASCTNFVQVATPPGTTYNDTGLTANTTYRYRVRATDAAGNLSGYSNIANATTQSGGGGTPGLVAAYAFDEGSGTTVSDASGSGNNGTVSGTTWTTSGKNGGALSFNGTSSSVSVPDASVLHS